MPAYRVSPSFFARSASSAFGTFTRSQAIRPGAKGDLTSPYTQHPYAHGAIRLIGQMLGSVPFLFVRDDLQARRDWTETVRNSKSQAERDEAMSRFQTLRQGSIRTAQDCLRVGYLRAPENPTIRVDDSPLQELFNRVNDDWARAEMWQALAAWLMLDGSALLVLLKKDGQHLAKGEKPDEIWPQRISGWQPELDEHGRIKSWSKSAGRGESGIGERTEFNSHEVILLRLFNPQNTLLGFGPVGAAMLQMEQDRMAAAWNHSFFENGGDPGTVLKLNQSKIPQGDSVVLNQDTGKQILRRWNMRHAGPGQANKTAVLPPYVDIERTPVAHRDMQFSEQFRQNRDAMLAALTLHKAALGVTDDLNRATIVEAAKMIWRNLLLPLMVYIEDRLFTAVFSKIDRGTVYGKFDLSGITELQVDFTEKITSAESLARLGVPLNDINENLGLGLPTYPWGDVALVDANKIPIEHVLDPFAGLSPGDGFDLEPPSSEPGDDPEPDPEPEPDEGEADRKKPMASGRRSAKLTWDPWWRAVGDQEERKFNQWLRYYWYQMRAEQLARFSQIKPLRAGGDDQLFTEAHVDLILFDGKPWRSRLQHGAEGFWRSTAENALREMGKAELTGISFKLTDPAFERFMEAKRIKVVKVTDNAREEVRRAMMQAVREGMTVNQAQDEIKRTFRGLATNARRLRIARTEISQAANGTRFLAMKSEGVEKVSWLTSNDPEVRESHRFYESLGPVPIGTNFLQRRGLSGTLKTPADPAGPPEEIVNCRCVLVVED